MGWVVVSVGGWMVVECGTGAMVGWTCGQTVCEIIWYTW